ncbi:MAG TPA: sulfite exporter TauE/SafE family protein [Sandaracinaceae bacterium LLY-WYZ-13_1]|nr:sulfite exporter TauE/SafE family protein [Sandaracinaceae bacterium LLY-WYZ-13_1]
MTLEPTLLGFAGIVFAAYAVQTVTGFGSMLLCVTFGAHLMAIPELVTLAVPVSLLQTGYIVVRHRDGIRWGLLLKRVLPLMGVGLAAGFFAVRHLGLDEQGAGARWLKIAFGVMVLVLAARELWLMFRARGDDAASLARPIPPAASVGAMLGAGVIHGIYATGGPLLVYAIGREGLPKRAFRSTLSAVWLVLNAVLAGGFLVEGRYDADTGLDLLVLLPAVPLGIVLGELLHHRVEERRFKIAVFVLLVAAAVSLLLRA